MQAKIARVQLDIDYLCPNCYLHFRLTNTEIPRDEDVDQNCPACNEPLKISPIYFEVKPIVRPEQVKDDEDSLRAIKALQAQGYAKKEAHARVRAVRRDSMGISELIREAISYEQPT